MSDTVDKSEEDDSESSLLEDEAPHRLRRSRSRIMYIEDKSEDLEGPAWIGRVHLSKTGHTLYYKGRRFRSLKGAGYKANYFDVDTGEHFWISGPRKDQQDRLYGRNAGVVVDDDVAMEYSAFVESKD
ncbi:MAG: 1-deoxy-D-xylulose-5-phosphate synthase [Pseudomonadota bacterium]